MIFVNKKGSDVITIFVRSTDSPFTKDEGAHDSGRLPDELKFVKFSSINWTPDSKGFFYQVWAGLILLLVSTGKSLFFYS